MFKNYAFCGKHMWTYVWKHICGSIMWTLASLVTQMVKNPSAMKEIWVRSLGWEDPLEKWIAIHSNILTWRILWTVSSMGSQRGAHDWATFTFTMQTIKSSINNDYVAIQTGEGTGTPLQYSCLEKLAVKSWKLAPWKKSCDKHRQCIKKPRHHFANKDPYSQSYDFSNSYIQMWDQCWSFNTLAT